MRINIEYWRIGGERYKITTVWLLGFIPIFRIKERIMDA